MPLLITLLAIVYLPGALIFRIPIADRPRRASLPAEERLFWGIVLSVAWSSCLCLGLALVGAYQFHTVIAANLTLAAVIVLAFRGRLLLGSSAAAPTWTFLLPLGLAVVGLWLNFLVPPAEYIMGGRDPGVYMNEGIQIAQRGNVVTTDDVAASVPAQYRDLFFLSGVTNRFMGFFLLDQGAGTVVGQFPHLYPAWIAMAYGVYGLSGARFATGLLAVLGLLAVYFLGARLLGRSAAIAGAGLLSLHVVQIWYARYPNAEMLMQSLIFAGLLAFIHAHLDNDRFFAPVAAVLLTLSQFAHLTSVFATVGVAIAGLVGLLYGQRVRITFAAPLIAGFVLATLYFMIVLPPYFQVPVGFVQNLETRHLLILALSVAIAALVAFAATRPAYVTRVRRWIPVVFVAVVWAAAAYAYFIRTAGGRLAPHDADSLRTFTSFYLTPLGLVSALVGLAVVTWRSFSAGAVLLMTLSSYAFFFFYKIRVVPEHFWASRRFLAVILPSALLLVGAAAFASMPIHGAGRAWPSRSWVPRVRYALGAVLVGVLGWQFAAASRPILHYVEYAGLIPRLEALAAQIGDDDLVLVAARRSSDDHVLALPLAYVYARNVLVLTSTNPDKEKLRDFLAWSRGRYRRTLFMGGGTSLVSRTVGVEPIHMERFQVPEYEAAFNAYPRQSRMKVFTFGIYELVPAKTTSDGFDLDIGKADDPYVRDFFAKETHRSGVTFRWTRDVSYISIPNTGPDHQLLTLWLWNGGRPPAAGPASVEVFFNDNPIGAATAAGGLEPHRFNIPPGLAGSVGDSEEIAQLKIVSSTWTPSAVLGGTDDRELGVMLDRIELK